MFSWRVNSFSDKINLKMVSGLYRRNFDVKTLLFTNTFYILHLYEKPTEYISKRASPQATSFPGSLILPPHRASGKMRDPGNEVAPQARGALFS